MEDTPAYRNANRGALILTVIWAECAIACIFVAARVYARTRLIHNMGIDDWMILWALLLAVVCTSIMTPEVTYGTGRHFTTLSPYEQVIAVKLNWISQPFSIMSAGFGKVSVALLLLRIISPNKARQWFLYTTIALLTVINTICVAWIFGQCTPAAKLWDSSIDGTCYPPHVQQDVGYWQASFASLTDIVLALYPITIIWNLQMKLSLKISLGSAMSLGLLAGAASIVKTIELKALTARSDYTWDTVTLVIWLATEMYTIIVAACIPTLKPLLEPIISLTTRGPTGKTSNASQYTDRLRYSRQGYVSHHDDEYRLRTLSSKNPASSVDLPTATDPDPAFETSVKAAKGLDDGIETVVEEPAMRVPGAIVKTTDINVSYRNQPKERHLSTLENKEAVVETEEGVS